MRKCKEVIAGLLITGALLAGSALWLNAAYRCVIFVVDYGCERGMNHVSDGSFGFYDGLAVAGGVAGLLGMLLCFSWKWRTVALAIVVANVLTCPLYYGMHQSETLVEYSESKVGKV